MVKKQASLAERILDTALELAESDGWESVNLHMVAGSLDISLDELRSAYPQKDDLVEAWFDRADKAILSAKSSEEFAALPAHERLHKIIMLWFLSMREHRSITRQMLYYKLEPGHIHLQILGILRISRTVQWFREAALLKTKNINRIIEEICITSIYVTSFAHWLFDESEGSQHTDQFLQRALKRVWSIN